MQKSIKNLKINKDKVFDGALLRVWKRWKTAEGVISALVLTWTLLQWLKYSWLHAAGEKGGTEHPFGRLNWEHVSIWNKAWVSQLSPYVACVPPSFILDPRHLMQTFHSCAASFPLVPTKQENKFKRCHCCARWIIWKPQSAISYLFVKTHSSGAIKWSNAKLSLILALSIYCTDWAYKDGVQQKVQKSFPHKAKQQKMTFMSK